MKSPVSTGKPKEMTIAIRISHVLRETGVKCLLLRVIIKRVFYFVSSVPVFLVLERTVVVICCM